MPVAPLPPAAERAPVVLVADDSPTVLAVVRASLEGDGYRVLTATDGAQALELARSGADEVDVVLLDVEMPGLDGHEVLAALKADPRLRDVPVLFLTGRGGATSWCRPWRPVPTTTSPSPRTRQSSPRGWRPPCA